MNGSLDDEERIGLPETALSGRNISDIRWRIEEETNITVEELAIVIGISTGAVHL